MTFRFWQKYLAKSKPAPKKTKLPCSLDLYVPPARGVLPDMALSENRVPENPMIYQNHRYEMATFIGINLQFWDNHG
jgi:hypothetical protein